MKPTSSARASRRFSSLVACGGAVTTAAEGVEEDDEMLELDESVELAPLAAGLELDVELELLGVELELLGMGDCDMAAARYSAPR
jgi:hypothetical protein